MSGSLESSRVAVIALGGADSHAAVVSRDHFPNASPFWLDRRRLRQSLIRLFMAGRFDDVLLVARDLAEPRMQLVTLLAALPLASRRWLADNQGRFLPFRLSIHLRRYGVALVTHLLACALTLLIALPAFLFVRTLLRTGILNSRRAPVSASRVLYLRSQFWLGLKGGGSVAHTAGVIQGLQEEGVDVRVVSSDRLPGVRARVSVLTPTTWFDGKLREIEQVAYNLPFLRHAWKVARAAPPEVLYQRYEALNIAGVLLSRLLRVPLVLEFNSSDVWKGRHWGGVHNSRLVELGEEINLLGAELLVVVSEPLRDDLLRAGVPRSRILVNPNGVDPRRFHPRVAAKSPSHSRGRDTSVTIGFSGTFGVWHGIETLAEAIPLVAAAYPCAQFLLIGDGPLRPLIDRVVQKHSLQNTVCFAGFIAHEDVPSYLAACDVLLSPHGQQADGGTFFGSPTKLYEYMAMGRALVASNVGQIGAVLRDGENAVLVPPGDPVALADAIGALIRDPALRARLGQAARGHAEQQHTWRQNARRVLDALAAAER